MLEFLEINTEELPSPYISLQLTPVLLFPYIAHLLREMSKIIVSISCISHSLLTLIYIYLHRLSNPSLQ